jgi:Na+-driven multidrug efflux pump
LDVVTPLKVSFFTNLVNMALDPIFIFTFGMGVAGAGLATAIAEILAVMTYLYVMLGKNMVTWKGMLTPPKFSSLAPLLVAGARQNPDSHTPCTAEISLLSQSLAILFGP